MNKYFKATLFLALPLAFLLECSKQSSTTSSSSSTPETTEIKTTETETTEKKIRIKNCYLCERFSAWCRINLNLYS